MKWFVDTRDESGSAKKKSKPRKESVNDRKTEKINVGSKIVPLF